MNVKCSQKRSMDEKMEISGDVIKETSKSCVLRGNVSQFGKDRQSKQNFSGREAKSKPVPLCRRGKGRRQKLVDQIFLTSSTYLTASPSVLKTFR